MKDKKSLLFIGIAVVISIVLFGIFFSMQPKGKTVVIQLDGKEYGTYPLEENQTIEIDLGAGEYNIVEIKDGKVDMIESTCENQICVYDYPLDEESVGVIVCLPHQLIVGIEER